MGLFDWIPCCGPRARDEKDRASLSESTTLLPPQRPGSILSEPGYGGTEGSQTHVTGVGTSGGLRAEQRARIEEIGREAGNFMLPISRPPGFPKSTTIDSSTSTPPRTHPSSRESSRPSSPSPLRPETSPAGGVLKSPPKEDEGESGKVEGEREGEGGKGEGRDEREGGGEEEEVEVVKKQVFLGTGGMGGGRKAGRGKPRGRGPRRGK